MRYTLNGIGIQDPAVTAIRARGISAGAPDLIAELERRRELSGDTQAMEARVVAVGPEGVRLRWSGSGGDRAATGELIDELRRWAGLGRRDFAHALLESPSSLERRLNRALEERGDDWRGFFLRLESGRLRAILPSACRGLDHLEVASAFREECRRWSAEGVDIRLDCCEETSGELFVSACAPSLAASVREGDWLYAGISLSNSECTLASTEVRPRIYRSVCANGAIAQEAEGEGFEIVRISERTPAPGSAEPAEPIICFREKLARAFELSFRPERVETEAAVGRAASRATLTSPFEHLQHLVARGILAEAERDVAQRLFDEGDDPSLYGLANAVTAAAHGLRDDSPRRAGALEHLGAAIVRGEHGPPVGVPVWA